MTLAHEYAHATLHYDLYKPGRFRSIDEFRTFYLNFPQEEHERLEWEAHTFASLLLVPPWVLSKRLTAEERKGIKIRSLDDKGREKLLVALAKEFGVPTDVVSVIMNEERFWEG